MRSEPSSGRPGRRLKAAAALAYNGKKDAAPRVVAVGRGRLAELIEERARETGVPVRKHEDLAWTLTGLGIDREIPPELYAAVAEVIAWVCQLGNEAGIKPKSQGV
ncbi:MAG: EscU/YscU/HrcU family type III secretion system export apparatus switch protein [Bacillota bacterium]